MWETLADVPDEGAYQTDRNQSSVITRHPAGAPQPSTSAKTNYDSTCLTGADLFGRVHEDDSYRTHEERPATEQPFISIDIHQASVRGQEQSGNSNRNEVAPNLFVHNDDTLRVRWFYL